MFVLTVLIFAIPQRLLALLSGMGRSMVPARWTNRAPVLAAYSQQYPLAPIPTPTPRLTI